MGVGSSLRGRAGGPTLDWQTRALMRGPRKLSFLIKGSKASAREKNLTMSKGGQLEERGGLGRRCSRGPNHDWDGKVDYVTKPAPFTAGKPIVQIQGEGRWGAKGELFS